MSTGMYRFRCPRCGALNHTTLSRKSRCLNNEACLSCLLEVVANKDPENCADCEFRVECLGWVSILDLLEEVPPPSDVYYLNRSKWNSK